MQTKRLNVRLGNANLRLSDKDRLFLSDLAKVRIIESGYAAKHCYEGRSIKDTERTLERFVKAGLLEKQKIIAHKGDTFNSYVFKNDSMARAYGGRKVVVGAKRNAYHELLVSRAYYDLNRPDGFKVEGDIKTIEREAMGVAIMPDAVCNIDGEQVFIEADSGQYTVAQIANKMDAWAGRRQVWAQPKQAYHKMINYDVQVLRY